MDIEAQQRESQPAGVARVAQAGHDHYTPDYFRQQVAKSDAKIEWEYARLLHLGSVRLQPGMRVLDLGCGAAPGLRYFAARQVAAVGLDVAPAALAEAKQLVPSCAVVCADLDRPLPLRDASADIIVLREVIEHLSDVPAALAEIWRVLRPGGVALMTTPNRWDARRPILRLRGRAWSGDADPTHVEIFDPIRLRRLLQQAGFERMRIVTGFKPVVRLGGRRLPRRFELPYPPLIGNGLVGIAWRT